MSLRQSDVLLSIIIILLMLPNAILNDVVHSPAQPLLDPLLVNLRDARSSNNTTSDDDSWIITDTEVINTSSVWSRDILIKDGGSLTFDSVSILFDTSAGAITINVSEGGVLKIQNGSSFDLKSIPTYLGYFIINYGELVIEDSIITYAGYVTPPNGSGCSSPNTSKWTYGPGISLIDGTAKIFNSTIQNSTYGILVEGAKLNIESTIFMNNFYAVYSYNSNGISIINSTFRINSYGLFCSISKNIIFENTLFEDNYYSAFLDNTDIKLSNSTMNIVGSGILAYTQSEVIVDDSVITNAEVVQPNSYNVYLENSRLEMRDSLSASGLWGVYLQNCTADINNTDFLDNDYSGLYGFQSDFYLSYSTIFGSNYGVTAEKSDAVIRNNLIYDNLYGIFALGSEPVIEFNSITDNAEYAVYALDSSFELGTGNVFIDSDNKTNRKGIIEHLNTVNVKVYDNFGNLLPFIEGEAVDQAGDVVFDNIIYIKGGIDGGKIWLTRFWIDNNGVRTEPGPYNLTVKWGSTDWGGYITATAPIELTDEKSISVTLSLDLPDIYVLDDEIELSKDKIEEGDTVTISIPIHTTGILSPTFTNVSVYINDKRKEQIPVHFDDNQTYIFSTDVEVEADLNSGDFRVRIEVENHEYEQLYYLSPYKNNNTASRSFEIEAADESVPLSFYTKLGFITVAIVIFLIVVVLVMRYMMVTQPGSEEEGGKEAEQEGDEKRDDKKKDRKVAKRPPKRPPKIEPPEMVRRL